MTDTTEKRLQHLTGQVLVIGLGLQAVLHHHPNKDAAALTLQENYENMMARMLPRGFSEDVFDGMKHALDTFLLKNNG